jgi:hypothetical protein
MTCSPEELRLVLPLLLPLLSRLWSLLFLMMGIVSQELEKGDRAPERRPGGDSCIEGDGGGDEVGDDGTEVLLPFLRGDRIMSATLESALRGDMSIERGEVLRRGRRSLLCPLPLLESSPSRRGD